MAVVTNLRDLVDSAVTSNVNAQVAIQAVQDAQDAVVDAQAEVSAASDQRVLAENAASIAELKASEAASSAVEAQLAETGAVDARNMAETFRDDAMGYLAAMNVRYDEFDDRYLGDHEVDPILDHDGEVIRDGAMYWNSTNKLIKVYNQTSGVWIPIKDTDGSLLITNNLSDLDDIVAARANLDVLSTAEIGVLLDTKEDKASKGVANGYAGLDANGLVPASQLPSYVDDVVEVATYADLPGTGETGKIYVVVADETSGGDTSSYRWTGSMYAMVSNTLTGADIKVMYEAELDTNAYTDAEKAKLAGLETSAELDVRDAANRDRANHTGTQLASTISDFDEAVTASTQVTTNTTKLAGIEDGATADQTGAEIKALYEAELNTNAFTDTEKAKLAGVEEGATADQTAEEIEALYEGLADTNKYTDAEKTKVADTEVTAQLDARDTANRNADNHTDGTVNGVYTLVERSKLASVEENAKDDQLASEVPYDNTASGMTATDVQAAVDELDGRADETDATLAVHNNRIATNAQNILVLATSNAVGMFETNTIDLTVTGTPATLTWDVKQQSNNTDKFELNGDNTITIKTSGTYMFTSTVTFEGLVNQGQVADVKFDVTDGTTVYYTQTESVEIDGYARDVVPFNSVMVVSSGATFPITARIDVSATGAGVGEYKIVGLSSILASEKAVGELSSQASDVQVDPQGNLSSNTVQSALEELQAEIDALTADSEW